MRIRNQIHIILALSICAPLAHAEMLGETKLVETSPNGIQEKCIATAKIAGGHYTEKDLELENEYCQIRLYDNSTAMCPKTWSTSPGTILFDISEMNKRSEDVEAASCKGKATDLPKSAKFKNSMNQSGTSGTYSQSSLLYYHMSRYFNTTVDVPAAVYRSIDKDAHLQRVTRRGKATATARMNMAGWDWQKRAEENPSVYKPTNHLFTDNNRQIYGILLKDGGERYGLEINGTRQGDQHQEFMKTPANTALQVGAPIDQAIQQGIQTSFKSSAMKAAFKGEAPSTVQMYLWMKEMTETMVLDYIFNQQDRVGNIDYRWVWLAMTPEGDVAKYKEKSDVSLTRKSSIAVPPGLAGMNAVLVQKTSIGDNDAGGRNEYANYFKSKGLLERIRHMNAETYRQLVRLAKDFEAQGPNYQYFKNTFDLDAKSLDPKLPKSMVANTIELAKMMITACESRDAAKKLRFDLVDYKQAMKGEFKDETLNCREP